MICGEKHLRKATKEHICFYCKSIIERGDVYYGLLATMGSGKGKLFNMLADHVCLGCAEKQGYIERKEDGEDNKK